MSEKIQFEKSCGNVFADLGLSDADELHLKAKIGFEIFRILEDRKLTQTDTEKILSADADEISDLINGKFNRYSIDRLSTFHDRE